MRKIFLSMMLLQEAKPTEYISEDFDIVEKKFLFPMTYIIVNNVSEREEITVITGVEKSNSNFQQAVINYELYKNEVVAAVENKNVKVNFVEISVDKEFTALTFNKFFKQVSGQIKDNDSLYFDVTFGMKPYCISMFVALAYVAKACNDVEVEAIIYAQKYSGSEKPENVNKSVIYDLTGLFYLNEIAGNLQEGDKKIADEMLNFIIDDK